MIDFFVSKHKFWG